MIIQLLILVFALLAIMFFFKNFNACVYFVVLVDIFLRIVTYLKINILRDDAFGFLQLIPADIPTIIRSFDIGMFVEIFIGVYIIIYIIFEILLVRLFVNRKF